jgi:enamine deaminase RidA (YjgF/YER057c/UK114 family)
LEEVGATMADMVQYTAYVTDVSKLNEFQEVRDKYINKANPAAGTLVEVKSLAFPDYLIEIEGIAVTQA